MLYSHGLPFSKKLDENINSLQDRVDLRKSALAIIDGGLGEGKTTLMIHLLDYINKINGLGPVDLKGPQLALGGSDFLKKIRLCYEFKLPCIGYDEAGDFSRRGSLTQFNAMINRTFETFRAFKCIVILALPNFNVLDNDIFDKHIPRLLLHLKNRTSKTGNYYGYSLYRIMLLRWKMSKINIKNYAYNSINPNFVGHFLDLDKERSRELDKISIKNKLNVLRKSEVKIEGLMNYPEMATKLCRSVNYVRVAVNNLNIKPNRIINRVKYFDDDALSRLADHLEVVTDRPKKWNK